MKTIVKIVKSESMVAAAFMFVGVLMASGVAHAQSLMILDKANSFFYNLLMHHFWQTLFGCAFAFFASMFAWRHELKYLLSAIGCAAAGSIIVGIEQLWPSVSGATLTQ